MSADHPYSQPEGWITKGAAQRDRPKHMHISSMRLQQADFQLVLDNASHINLKTFKFWVWKKQIM